MLTTYLVEVSRLHTRYRCQLTRWFVSGSRRLWHVEMDFDRNGRCTLGLYFYPFYYCRNAKWKVSKSTRCALPLLSNHINITSRHFEQCKCHGRFVTHELICAMRARKMPFGLNKSNNEPASWYIFRVPNYKLKMNCDAPILKVIRYCAGIVGLPATV